MTAQTDLIKNVMKIVDDAADTAARYTARWGRVGVASHIQQYHTAVVELLSPYHIEEPKRPLLPFEWGSVVIIDLKGRDAREGGLHTVDLHDVGVDVPIGAHVIASGVGGRFLHNATVISKDLDAPRVVVQVRDRALPSWRQGSADY